MAIEKFVETGSIDPMYFDGSYYLAPDGDAVQGVYAVLRQAISETGRVALARIVVGQRERTIGERSAAGGLIAHTPDEQRTSTMQDQPEVIPAVKEEPRASGVIHDDSDAQRADKAEACCRCLRCQTRPQAGVGWGLIWVQPSDQTYLATTFIKAYFAEQLIVGGKVAKLESAHVTLGTVEMPICLLHGEPRLERGGLSMVANPSRARLSRPCRGVNLCSQAE